MSIIKSPFKDKNGKVICNGDFTRQLVIVDEPRQRYWVFDQVRFEKGEWYVYDYFYDYVNGTDKPHLLSSCHSELEIIDEGQIKKRSCVKTNIKMNTSLEKPKILKEMILSLSKNSHSMN